MRGTRSFHSSLSESKAKDRSRTSCTLENLDVLRGTTTKVLLEDFGRRLRSTPGGIGFQSDNAAHDEYKKSFVVNRLDIFLSHSWHAWWLHKYLTLLLYFNAKPAIISAVLVAVLVAPPSSPITQVASFFLGLESPLCLHLGSATFFTILLSAHHIGEWRRYYFPRFGSSCNFGSKTIFLDKVCIHQTDLAQKEKGIKEIGAILANSDKVLVAWDKSYFTRLWCTYELSAYYYSGHAGKTRVVFLPVRLGGLIAALSVAMFLIEELPFQIRFWSGNEKETGWPDWREQKFLVVHIPLYSVLSLITIRMLRRFVGDLAELEKQLSGFTMQDANCFCCQHEHLHPETGAALPCDRKLVYNSIAHWHGGGDEQQGLLAFDLYIQGTFQDDVKRTLGGWSQTPYPFVCCFSLFPALRSLANTSFKVRHDEIASCLCAPLVGRCMRFFDTLLFSHPMSFGLVCFLMQQVPAYQGVAKFALDVIMAVIMVCTTVMVYVVRDRAFAFNDGFTGTFIGGLWMLFEAFANWQLYWSRGGTMLARRARDANLARREQIARMSMAHLSLAPSDVPPRSPSDRDRLTELSHFRISDKFQQDGTPEAMMP